ncbi:MAG TPA: N-acetylmuramoyl-L-alanine amidase, partial [Planctomycetes bacterium]|nr:N-acetylmuramoyl-L-alanine amidase [Planctomycetota bacterium]
PGAELELAEGRVQMTRRDMQTTSPEVLRHRLDLAEAGFHRVLSNSRTRPYQRSQATRGLSEVERLRDGTGAAADLGTLGPILPRSAWGAAPAAPTRLTVNTHAWSRITVHHTATDSTDPGVIRRIQKNHMEQREFGDIGYHFLIDGSGRIFQGRDLRWQGAHADRANNIANIGICLLGNFNEERPTAAALHSLEGLIEALRGRHHIERSRVLGHQELKATDCPGRYLEEWVRAYRTGRLTSLPRARSQREHSVASVR